MTTKLFLIALLGTFATLLLLDAKRPVGAAEVTPAAALTAESLTIPPVISWPAPQAPFNTTPITPVESAGASPFEPF